MRPGDTRAMHKQRNAPGIRSQFSNPILRHHAGDQKHYIVLFLIMPSYRTSEQESNGGVYLSISE